MLLVDEAHPMHGSANLRVPYSAIPARAFEFAREHGYMTVLDNRNHYPRRTA